MVDDQPCPPSRRALLGAAGLGALAATVPTWSTSTSAASAAPAATAAPTGRGRKLNVVVILADDFGYGGLGSYGNEVLKTPNIDRLAHEGIRFTQGYSGAPVCAASRAALLTGVHTGRARVRDNTFTQSGVQPAFLPEDTTIGQVMKAGGYRTGIFGKWGFGDDDLWPDPTYGLTCDIALPKDMPTGDPAKLNIGDPSHPRQKGFDEFVGMVRHDHATYGYYAPYLWHDNQRVYYPGNEDGGRGTYAPDVYTAAALDFIDRNADDPFFLLYTPQLVHWPELIPDEWMEPYADRPWPDEAKRYAGQYTLLDTYVGRIIDRLKQRGLAENTLVIFTGDNGPATIERLAGSSDCTDTVTPTPELLGIDIAWNTNGGLNSSKYSLYDGGIKVPLVAWGPGVVRHDGATVADRPWYSPDLMPTLADFAGVSTPTDLTGVSVRGWLTGESSPSHPPLYWEAAPYAAAIQAPHAGTFGEAIRVGKWKLYRHILGNNPDAADALWVDELYDLDADPRETFNRALVNREVVEELTARIHHEHTPAPFKRAAYRPKLTGRGWIIPAPKPLTRLPGRFIADWSKRIKKHRRAVVGHELQITRTTLSRAGRHAHALVSYQWYVDGRPVSRGRHLHLRRAWLGKRVAAHVAVTAPGHRPAVHVLAFGKVKR